MEKRVFSNPHVKDKVTFVKTSKETGGEYSLLELELAPGGGTPLHAHTSFDEQFTAIDGVVGIVVEKNKILISPGESATAPLGKFHRFYNPGKTSIRFEVKIVPSCESFENSLKIAYGLAEDGKANKKGIPKSFSHLALLTTMADTVLPGALSLILPVIRWKAKQAIKKGIDQELIKKYC
jgi:mannose-6-phosphate isomerase-like protein (cupin superfamily)